MNNARFLNYIWPFFNIMNRRVNLIVFEDSWLILLKKNFPWESK